jgi:hypothetical protein
MHGTAFSRCQHMLKKLDFLRFQLNLPPGHHDRKLAAQGHRPSVMGKAGRIVPHEHMSRYAEGHEHDFNRRIRWLVDQQVRHENEANAHHQAGNRGESQRHSQRARELESEIEQMRGMRDSEANRIHDAGYARYSDPRMLRRSRPTKNVPAVLLDPPGSCYESPYRHYGFSSFGKKATRLPNGGGIRLSKGRSGTRYAQRPRPYSTYTMREPVI